MPFAGKAPEGQFLAPRVDALFLCQGKEVLGREILVKRHVVVQVLVGRDGREDEPWGGVLRVQAAVQQAAAVE